MIFFEKYIFPCKYINLNVAYKNKKVKSRNKQTAKTRPNI